MAYSVKEIFYTLQGEGRNAGRAAVFCRFAGCNLWSGREADRAAASCRFCDTDFVGIDGDGGSKFASADDLTTAIVSRWPTGFDKQRFVVLTGGEPLLQVDTAVITSLHSAKFAVAVETNGTIRPPVNIDWICVSPKADAHLAITEGDELKLVFPQKDAEPERYEQMAFQHFLLQPMDGPSREANTVAAAAYCLANPRWRLTLQTHKMVGLR